MGGIVSRGGAVMTSKMVKSLVDLAPSSLTIMAATVATYTLNNHFLKLGPVLSSSIIGLLSALFLPSPKLALAALCGSFAGMAKTAVIPAATAGVGPSLLLGLNCAFFAALFDRQKWLVGVGGRLGFIAQCACTFQFLMSSFLFPPSWSPSAGAALMGRPFPDVFSLMRGLPRVALFTAVGAFAMRSWKDQFASHSRRLSSPTAAVGGTGLLAASILPASLAGPVFCGSFVAMAAPDKVPDAVGLLGASLLAGVAQQCMAGLMLGGWGGKLGTAALVGVLAYMGLQKMMPVEENVSGDGGASVTVPTVNVRSVVPQNDNVSIEEQPKKKLSKVGS